MRVAITNFYGVSHFAGARLWRPFSPLAGEISQSHIHPKIAQWLTRGGPPATRRAMCFGCSKPVWAWEKGFWANQQTSFENDLARHGCIGGERFSITAACATASHALALGVTLIQENRADFVLAGALEPPQHPMTLAAYKNMGALSRSGTMRPFDARRDGFLPASGAGFLILEPEEKARNRGAQIQGFLSGYSMKCDATSLTSMSAGGDSIARAIEDAMKRAGHPALGYINAHGTGTIQNDAVEARGIELALGTQIPVSSTKPLTGHLLGAAGAVEAILCLLAMKDEFLPPTLGLENVDDTMNLDFVIGVGRSALPRACLSLNYGFGGHIGALIFEGESSLFPHS